MTSRVFARLYLPHLTIFPLVLFWRLACDGEPSESFWWLPGFFLGTALLGLVVAWAISSVRVGRSLIGLGPLVAGRQGLFAIDRFLTRIDRSHSVVGDMLVGCVYISILIGILLAAAGVLGFAAELRASPLAFAVTCQIVDLTVLTVALWRCGAHRIFRERAERERLAGDGAAAIAAVRSFYTDNLALLSDEFPGVRFESELRVRIPDPVSPDEAWRAAREFIAELQDAARRAKQRNVPEVAVPLPADPVRDREEELRTLIGHLDTQAGQTGEEITRLRGQGVETAWLERQLAIVSRMSLCRMKSWRTRAGITHDMKTLEIPAYLIHAQVLEIWQPPSMGFVIAGLWWTDVYQMGEHFKSVQMRRDENRGAAYFGKKAFADIASFPAAVTDKSGNGLVDRFACDGSRARTTRVVANYHHGYGGGGPVTHDAIQHQRRSVYLPDADLVLSGHTHDLWTKDIARLRLGQNGTVYHDVQVHVKCGTYKEEYRDGYGGWAVEKGFPPKPTGAWWVRFFWDWSKERVLFELIKAQ